MGRSFPSFFLTKKKLAAYELHDSQIVPLFRCSSTNLWTSIISSWVSGSSWPGSDLGAFGSNSIAWSHIVWCGSLWDFFLSNTFLCHLYLSVSSTPLGYTFFQYLSPKMGHDGRLCDCMTKVGSRGWNEAKIRGLSNVGWWEWQACAMS